MSKWERSRYFLGQGLFYTKKDNYSYAVQKGDFFTSYSQEDISFSSRSMNNVRALAKVLILVTSIFLPLVLRNNYSLNAPNFRHITLDWQELKMRDQKAWSFNNLCIFKINCNLKKHWHIHVFVRVLKKGLTAFRVLLTLQILLFKHCIGNNFSTCGLIFIGCVQRFGTIFALFKKHEKHHETWKDTYRRALLLVK